MIKYLHHIFTSRDNSSYSLSKLIGMAGSCAMVFNFVKVGSIDFQGLGIGLSTLIAALAAKYFVEDKEAE